MYFHVHPFLDSFTKYKQIQSLLYLKIKTLIVKVSMGNIKSEKSKIMLLTFCSVALKNMFLNLS